MRAFLDLGAFEGEMLSQALSRYKGFDRFDAFEPYTPSYQLLKKKFRKVSNVVLHNVAAGIRDGKERFYLHQEIKTKPRRAQGNSMLPSKKNVDPGHFIFVDTLDFSRFVLEHFKSDDEIILKVDIEGMEYNVLEKMIHDGSIHYISKLYCEWHFEKAQVPKERHDLLVEALRCHGLSVTGTASDEFKKAVPISSQ